MKNKQLEQFYDGKFYKDPRGSIRSAQIILGLLFKFYQPQSVVDFGCGVGGWLAAAEALGSKTLKGFDGDWVPKESLFSKNIDFVPVNLEEEFEIERRYDLAMSVEVAEHLSETRAKPFVDMLCKASDVVLFGAAAKGQGGTNHINEQWQSYWINLFHSNRYDCFDIFRGVIWDNDQVDWWYRQNIFLFVNRDTQNTGLNLEMLKAKERMIPDVVHPSKIEDPTFGFCLDVMKKYIRRKANELTR